MEVADDLISDCFSCAYVKFDWTMKVTS
jgi:hypothetical protein